MGASGTLERIAEIIRPAVMEAGEKAVAQGEARGFPYNWGLTPDDLIDLDTAMETHITRMAAANPRM